jgi:predicted DsbA family dithiol-disulfide isomerase
VQYNPNVCRDTVTVSCSHALSKQLVKCFDCWNGAARMDSATEEDKERTATRCGARATLRQVALLHAEQERNDKEKPAQQMRLIKYLAQMPSDAL